MTKENFIYYVRQYRTALGFIRDGMKNQTHWERDLFSSIDIGEICQEHLVFWEFYHWVWFKSGWSIRSEETFNESDLKQTFKAIDEIADRLLKTNDYDFKIIKKTWNRFLANLMLEFKEVQKWIN